MKTILSTYFVLLILCFEVTSRAQSFRNTPLIYDQCLQEAQVIATPGFAKAQFQPFVIEPGESFGLYITLDQSGYKQIDIVSTAFNGLKSNNQLVTTLTLKDDGTQGDLKAGDNIFSNGMLSFPSTAINYPAGWFLRFCDVTFTANNGNTETKNIDLGFGIRTIPTGTPVPIVKKLNDTVQYSDYVMNLVAPASRADERFSLSKTFYKYFPDDRDFLIRSTTYPTPGDDIPAANFYSVKFNTLGTNIASKPFYDRSADYGSSGKLQGFINMFYIYGGQAALLNHECLHNWAAYIDPNLKITISPHWGYTVFPSSGFGSGNQIKAFTKLTDTTFTINSVTNNSYNTLELYLMGLLPADSLAFPIQTLLNASISSITAQGIVIKTSGLQEISKTQYFNAMAVRSPGIATSQKSFKVGSIVLSDRLLTPKELSYYHEIMKENENKNQTPTLVNAAMNFFTATRGKAELVTRIATLSTPIQSISSDSPIKIYPNPATDRLRYKIPSGNTDHWIYDIHDDSGRSIKKGKLTGSDIEIKNLTSGFYFIHLINSKNREFIQKIIVLN